MIENPLQATGSHEGSLTAVALDLPLLLLNGEGAAIVLAVLKINVMQLL